MDKEELDTIIAKVEKEEQIFTDKSYLSTISVPEKIIGRQKQTEAILRYLLGFKRGHIVPLISVYGRSGSGKSTIVKFVCENLKDTSYCFVNLRQARTVFGAANLILEELGEEQIKSAHGFNESINRITVSIISKLEKENKKVFILVLDEIDVLFYDKRGKPSDFFYKLTLMEEKLLEKGYLVSVIAISNHLISDYELDDRVRSRIGNSEVFFEPYSKEDVINILSARIKKAFSESIDQSVVEHSAKLSSDEHGDARRAIDLLRVAAQLAGSKGEKISKAHVDFASDELQRDVVTTIISSASYHLKTVCFSIAALTHLTENDWHATSDVYKQYLESKAHDIKPVTYRRISELLTDLENSGIIVSQLLSKGRRGYGRQYKLTISPEIVGRICSEDAWKRIVSDKDLDDLFRVATRDFPKHYTSAEKARKKVEILERNLKKYSNLEYQL